MASVASLLISLALVWSSVASAAPEQDRVTHLPGLVSDNGELEVSVWSGFLQSTPTDRVHYMLYESESSPSTDPLVLWVQGGPGASSLLGAFEEFGPYIIASKTGLVRNPFAWSKVANLLVLESPTGVGFSYCEAMTRGAKCDHNDTSTAELNLESLKRFVELFPEFKGRDFMIWGESYAGVFVPTLAERIFESGDLNSLLNFKGFSVGDPCTSEKYQFLGGQLHFNVGFAYHNGFISQKSYYFLMDNCVTHDANDHVVPDDSKPACKLAWRVYYLQTSNNDGQNMQGQSANFPASGKFINTFNDYGPDGGPFETMLRDYLSSAEVRAALHVTEAPIGRWGMGENLVYTKEHLACFYEEGTPPSRKPKYDWDMLEIYRKLAGNIPRIVVFNGDTDPDVQYRGTEAAIESLGLGVQEGGGWRPWFYQSDGASMDLIQNKTPYWGETLSFRGMGPQLGGYVKDFDKNVSFLTVHTSGHMVPQYKPVAALQLFKRVVAGLPLSPPLDEEQIAGLSDAEFFGYDNGTLGYMGQWVGLAQSPQYTGFDDHHHDQRTEAY